MTLPEAKRIIGREVVVKHIVSGDRYVVHFTHRDPISPMWFISKATSGNHRAELSKDGQAWFYRNLIVVG